MGGSDGKTEDSEMKLNATDGHPDHQPDAWRRSVDP
jgi:hypothetical protein